MFGISTCVSLTLILCAPLALAQSGAELLRLGEQRLKQERLAEAKSLFQQATKLTPTAAAWEDLAMAALLSGDLRQAASAARELVSLDAGNYNAHLTLGVAAFEAGKFQAALTQVNGLGASDPLALSIKAAALNAMNRRKEAIHERTRLAAVTIDPRDAVLSAHIFRSGTLQQSALEMLQRASMSGPDNLSVLRELGNVNRSRRNWSGAESAYRRALVLKPGDPRLLVRLAEVVSRQNRQLEVGPLLVQAQNSLDDDPAVLLDFGVIGVQLRFFLEARAALGKALAFNPENPEAHYHMGVVEGVLGRSAEAEMQYRAALVLTPGDARFHLALGHLFLENAREEEARPELEIAAQSSSTAAHAMLYLARIQKLEGEPQKARQMLLKAAQLNPRDAEILAELAAVELSLDDSVSAGSHINAALKLDPRCVKAHIHHSRLLAMQGKSEEAKRESLLGEQLRKAESEVRSLKAVQP